MSHLANHTLVFFPAQPKAKSEKFTELAVHSEQEESSEESFLSNSIRQASIKRTLSMKLADRTSDYKNEKLNFKAVVVINRVRDKLTGRDFDSSLKSLGISQQVDLLINQATSHENLCQCYIGWCPFW